MDRRILTQRIEHYHLSKNRIQCLLIPYYLKIIIFLNYFGSQIGFQYLYLKSIITFIMKIRQYQMSASGKTVDYRNAKYQGQLNQLNQRDGLGVLVDDDLSFYTSQWRQNQLSGNTIAYLSHAKYIYGQWKDNQPHGLNVFRIGDTVLVGVLQNGQISGRALIIFQRFNFIAVLQRFQITAKINTKNERNDDFRVIKSGQLHNHQDLLENIKLLNVKVPECYFSLTKFIFRMVNEVIKARSMKSGHCYFGYEQGLAIVFNSNNAVVSVGVHSKGKVTEFGGKFSPKGESQQGNFQTAQTIIYKASRPKNQIYSIFQKIHKRSLYFQNHYFYSKVKTLAKVQNLLRGKIAQIAESSRKQLRNFTANDLNQSLDYHALNQNQEEQINANRKAVYQNPIKEKIIKVKIQSPEQKSSQRQKTKTPIKRSPSFKVVRKTIDEYNKNFEEKKKSPICIPKLQKNKKTSIISQKFQTLGQQKPDKNTKIKYFQNLKTEKPKHSFIQTSKQKQQCLNIEQNVNASQNNLQEQLHFTFKNQKDQNSYVDSLQQTKKMQKLAKAIKRSQIQQVTNQISHFKNNRVQKSQQIEQKKGSQLNRNTERHNRHSYISYDSPPAKRSSKKTQQVQERSKSKLSQSPYKLNAKYEDLNERRSRLLKQFKNLNQNQSKPDKQAISPQIACNKMQIRSVYEVNQDSPYKQQRFLNSNSINSKSQQSSNGCIPLSIAIADQSQKHSYKVSTLMKSEVPNYTKRTQITERNKQSLLQVKSNKRQSQFSEDHQARKENIPTLKATHSPLSYLKQEKQETFKKANKQKEEGIQSDVAGSSKNSYTPSRRKQYQYQYCFQ